jgi:hypothetical protein
MTAIRTKTVETFKLTVEVIQRDIDEGKCGLVSKCMEKISIERALRKIDPKGGDHKVRIDAGIVKFALKGYRWRGITPKIAKRSLIQFDKEARARAKAEKEGRQHVSRVKPHKYRMEVERMSKITPFTKERLAQVYEARERRAAEGRPDKRTYDLHHRVVGLGSV